jgi:beta-lactamase regulating signal transducer with metallopeptidase domain
MRTLFSGDFLPFGTSLFVDASWKGLLLLVLAASAAFAAKKASAAVRHRIWFLSLSALIVLPVVSVFVPRWEVALLARTDVGPPHNIRERPNSPIARAASDVSKSHRSSDSVTERSAQIEPAGPGWPSMTNPFARTGGGDETRWSAVVLIRTLLLISWLLVSLILLVRLALESAAVRRLIGRGRPPGDERWNGPLDELRARLHVPQTVRLLECDEAIVPATCGLLRPAILLPALSAGWNTERRRLVLLHELAHVKRFDVWSQMLARMVCSINWFNPLAWYALARLRIERELACDDCVVEMGANPIDYADQLIEIARLCRSSRYVAGVPMASSSDLESRVVALLDRARSHRLLSWRSSGLLLLAAFLVVLVAAAFQPVTRAALGDPARLTLTGKPTVSGTAVLAQRESAQKRDAEDAASALVTDSGIDGIVLTPDGKPAEKAQVALEVPGSRILVVDGKLDGFPDHSRRTQTDRAGRFHFSPEKRKFELIIVHPTGIAMRPKAKRNRRIFKLNSWSRVEGTFRVGGKPLGNVPLSIFNDDKIEPDDKGPSVGVMCETKSGRDGHFVFEHVPPGRVRIGRDIPLDEVGEAKEIVSVCKVPMTVAAGATAHLDLGVPGRIVVGKLRLNPGLKGDINWRSGHVTIYVARSERLPADSSFFTPVGREGAFRIEDVPPGKYDVTAVLPEGSSLYLLEPKRVVVPKSGAKTESTPFDLGVLTLEK